MIDLFLIFSLRHWRKAMCRLGAVALLLALSVVARASVRVELEEPEWTFLLGNQPLMQTQASLKPGESGFAREVQPLLAAGDQGAVLAAFAERNIEEDSAALRLLRGQVLLSLKRPDEAEAALQAALDLMPDLSLAHRNLGMVYLLNKDYPQAAKHLARSIELGIADAQIYGQLAYVNLQREMAASAVSGYQMALFLDPKNMQWRQGLLFALINSQAVDQAQALLEEMLKEQPENADLWLQRGQIALSQEREMQALSSLEHAIDLGDKNPVNLVIVAQLHIKSGSPRRAVDLLAANMGVLAKRNQASDMDTLNQMAGWLAHQQLWDELDQLLNAVDRQDIQLAGMLASQFDVYRAQVAMQRGQTSNARHNLEEALEADPANGEALLSLATLLRDQNRADAAVSYYVRAQALPMYRERAQLGRAQLEIDRQNYEEALRILRHVGRGSPRRSDVQANIRSLENLVRQRGGRG